MISELFLYDPDEGLFKAILKQSKVIAGRYHVSPNFGNDLNTNNLANSVKDYLKGLTEPEQKYPLSVCMQPTSRFVRINGAKWEEFSFTIFFLCRAEADGLNKIKKLDRSTNTSMQRTWYDWSDMKQCAADFLEILHQVILNKLVSSQPLKSILNIDYDPSKIVRLTKFNNDVLNGVGITFLATLATDGCNIKDYNDSVLSDVVIPELTIYT